MTTKVKNQRKIIGICSGEKGLLNLEDIPKGGILEIDGKKELIIKKSRRITSVDANQNPRFKGKITTIRRGKIGRTPMIEGPCYEIIGINEYFPITDLLQYDSCGIMYLPSSFSYDRLNRKLNEAGIIK